MTKTEKKSVYRLYNLPWPYFAAFAAVVRLTADDKWNGCGKLLRVDEADASAPKKDGDNGFTYPPINDTALAMNPKELAEA